MVATNAPVILCVYPDREHAEPLVALLRGHGIPVVAVPSDRHVGEWDVLAPDCDAGRATKMLRDLLEID